MTTNDQGNNQNTTIVTVAKTAAIYKSIQKKICQTLEEAENIAGYILTPTGCARTCFALD